jgi:hypothetical protein
MDNKIPTPHEQPKPEKRPDDTGSVALEGFVKIFDPKTRKVFVEQKA